MVVEGWLARAAAARPAHPALITPAGSWSYAQLLAAADAGAQELAHAGVQAGARVAIALPGGLAFAQALHACMLLGAVAVPVDTRLTPRERAQVSAGSAQVIAEPLPPAPPRSGVRRPRRGRTRAQRPPGARAHALDATAVVLHTSGTSSAPRAVELTYGNFLWSALGSAAALGLDPHERWLCALPVAHVGGLSIIVRSAIYATTAVVHERFEAERALHALREGRVTVASLVATTLARLLDAGLDGSGALRCALTGGGPVPAELRARARTAGVPACLTYGLTEACSQVSTTPLAALASEEDGPGPPLFCTRVRIGAAPGEQAGGGEEGEITIAGPTVAPTAAAPDGWLRSGDLGRLDERGRLHVTGRASELIVSGGENVAPEEVEAVLESHADVLEAAVVGRPDARWGEAVTAVVVPRPGTSPRPQELLAHCARALARHKLPKQIALTSEPLPRTASGKLLRRKLR
jgi:O-succinylbenzoic acid--CoA ligase